MGLGWGEEEKPVVDPAFAAVLEKNASDVFAIVQIIGIQNVPKLWPHLSAMLKTYDAAKQGSKS